jgi:hypothetical protein
MEAIAMNEKQSSRSSIPIATGKNIARLRVGTWFDLSVTSSPILDFEEPQAIYKWQQGKSLPTVDNLYALGALLRGTHG